MDRDGVLASRIAATHGLTVESIEELRGLGSVNHTFIVGRGKERCVIRFAVDPLRDDELATEAWCLHLASSQGIASPEVLAYGRVDGIPYLVQRFIEHVARNTVSRRYMWETLGTYARRINEFPLAANAPEQLFSRFGRDLSAAWQAHLAYNLTQLVSEDPLSALDVYPAEKRPGLRDMIVRLADTKMSFGLSHGDLASGNVLVRPDGALVLIDWGAATCGPIPYTDLLILERNHASDDDPSIQDLAAYAVGYDLDLGRIGPTLDAIRKLTALDLVRWVLDRRPDQLTQYVEWARQELTRATSI